MCAHRLWWLSVSCGIRSTLPASSVVNVWVHATTLNAIFSRTVNVTIISSFHQNVKPALDQSWTLVFILLFLTCNKSSVLLFFYFHSNFLQQVYLRIRFITHTHTRLTALCLGLPRWAGTWKVKPTWILLEQETVSGSGISWAICKSAHRSRQITTPAPHHSVFYRLDALSAAQPTASKHWRHL